MKNGHDFLIVEGVKFPPPDKGLAIGTSQAVDSGRNANYAFVGQKVGRRIWKIDGLQWSGLDAESWAEMKSALDPFTVLVTFTGDDNKRHTIHMFPGDTNGKPLSVDQFNQLFYKEFEICKFNLIDCGWDEE